MERKLYIGASVLVWFAALTMALHMFAAEHSVPDMVTLRGRHYGYTVSRDFYMHRLFLGLFMLPLICAMFGFVAHRGRAVDFVSWFFLAAFYVALWWFRWEVTQLINAPATGVRVGSVTDPLEVLLLAVATGFGFWRWKQASDPTVADTQELP